MNQKVSYNLRPEVSSRTIKKLEEFKLLHVEGRTISVVHENLLPVFTDDEKLRALCTALFGDQFKEVQAEDIDCAKVMVGLTGFLQSWWTPTNA